MRFIRKLNLALLLGHSLVASKETGLEVNADKLCRRSCFEIKMHGKVTI